MSKTTVVSPKPRASAGRKKADDYIHLRAASWQKAIIRAGAEAAGSQKLTEYVLKAVIDRAEKDILEKRVFVMGDRDWGDFMAALDSPPKVIPELKKLLRGKDVFEA